MSLAACRVSVVEDGTSERSVGAATVQPEASAAAPEPDVSFDLVYPVGAGSTTTVIAAAEDLELGPNDEVLGDP